MQEGVKRVAKNTVIMFIRMLVLMIIGFLTSRWLLKQLGVEDYGIYSVVGSVTSTFVALKSLFSESTQRFLNFYKGKNDLETQKQIFSISIVVHIALVFIFIVILEAVGLWFIKNKLVFPMEKYYTVIFVFEMTVISSVFSILCIPFDALIMANERMGFFAFVSILDGFFRLAVVLGLPFLPYESLKVYSLLLVFIPVSSLLITSFYCKRFPEFSFSVSFNKPLFKEMVSLSGWNFFGNISFSLLHEGINFVLNIYGGLVYNTARAIAYQVKSIADQFSNNSLIAIRPMVMQSAAIDDEKRLLFCNIIEVSRISFLIMLLPIVPLEAFCSELLHIWLADVPDYSVLFTRLVLLSILFRSFHEPLNMLYMSLGRIKRMMIIEVLVMLSALFSIYMVLSHGAPLWASFVILGIMEITIIVCLLVNAAYEVEFPGTKYLKNVTVPMLLLFSVCFIIIEFVTIIPSENIFMTLLLCLLVLMSVIVAIYFFLNKSEKNLINTFILSKLHNNIKR